MQCESFCIALVDSFVSKLAPNPLFCVLFLESLQFSLHEPVFAACGFVMTCPCHSTATYGVNSCECSKDFLFTVRDE